MEFLIRVSSGLNYIIYRPNSKELSCNINVWPVRNCSLPIDQTSNSRPLCRPITSNSRFHKRENYLSVIITNWLSPINQVKINDKTYIRMYFIPKRLSLTYYPMNKLKVKRKKKKEKTIIKYINRTRRLNEWNKTVAIERSSTKYQWNKRYKTVMIRQIAKRATIQSL